MGEVTAYNECIIHETLRVAVCGMMERPTFENIEGMQCDVTDTLNSNCWHFWHAEFPEVMNEYFLKNYEQYVKVVVEKAAIFDGKNMEV